MVQVVYSRGQGISNAYVFSGAIVGRQSLYASAKRKTAPKQSG
jgi:hypothetical protein